MRGWNFSAGPAAIPEEVIQEVKNELLEFKDSGTSIIEVSHRTDLYSELAFESKQDLIEILDIPESHEVLFLQGGATHQFSMIPLNFKNLEGNADYVVSGTWSKKAAVEAEKLINVNVIASSEGSNFSNFPQCEEWKFSNDSAYVHFCPNETMQGIAMHEAPKFNKHIVADMTSVILSEPLDVNNYSLIYAGAQKNIGPAGLAVVIISKDFMNQANKDLPKILQYAEHSKADSMLNTPPIFSWYVAGKVFKWIKRSGGLEHFQKLNRKKAEVLYEFLDSSDFYLNKINKNQRSVMNITFNLANEQLNETFLKESKSKNLLNLKGHALVGGMRASIYNAMPLEGVEQLVQFMKEFESEYG
mgnify:FL=1